MIRGTISGQVAAPDRARPASPTQGPAGPLPPAEVVFTPSEMRELVRMFNQVIAERNQARREAEFLRAALAAMSWEWSPQ